MLNWKNIPLTTFLIQFVIICKERLKHAKETSKLKKTCWKGGIIKDKLWGPSKFLSQRFQAHLWKSYFILTLLGSKWLKSKHYQWYYTHVRAHWPFQCLVFSRFLNLWETAVSSYNNKTSNFYLAHKLVVLCIFRHRRRTRPTRTNLYGLKSFSAHCFIYSTHRPESKTIGRQIEFQIVQFCVETFSHMKQIRNASIWVQPESIECQTTVSPLATWLARSDKIVGSPE